MAGNAAIDHSGALAKARNNMPNAEKTHPGDLHMNGASDNHIGSQRNGRGGNYSRDIGKLDNHSDRLAVARRISANEIQKNAKDLAAISTPVKALSLLKEINPVGDMPYVLALGAALLKDLLDMIDAGTIILPIIFSILCSIFIFMMMLVVGSNGKKNGARKLLRRIGVLGAGGVADSIPGIDFLPIETFTVVIVYIMELIERKNGQK